MVNGLSPSIERKRPNLFKESKPKGVAINIIEEMFNHQEDSKSNNTEDRGFPSTPCSVKLSNKSALTEAFRVSLFIHDFLMTENQEDGGEFGNKDLNIMIDDIQDEIEGETNLLMTFNDINSFAT